MLPSPLLLLLGGSDSLRSQLDLQLRALGYAIEHAATLDKPLERYTVVVVLGGKPASRREPLPALIDLIAELRRASAGLSIVCAIDRIHAEESVAIALDAGADNVLMLPAGIAELRVMVQGALRLYQTRDQLQRVTRYCDALAETGTAVESSLESPEGLHDVLARVADALDCSRVALILLTEGAEEGLLVAASDEKKLLRETIRLERYPEVRASLERGSVVLVEDVRTSSLMGPWAQLAATHGGNSIISVPLFVHNRAIGALLLRATDKAPAFGARAHDFLRTAALLLGLLLRSGKVLDTLREQTKRLAVGRLSEEERTRALEQHREFFESFADGMIVLDGDGLVLYLNRTAQEVTGYAQSGLTGHPFDSIVLPEERDRIPAVLYGVLNQAVPSPFDLRVSTTSGEVLNLSVVASSALAEHGCVVLTFRDVSEARLLEQELGRNRDFLERLINSTVDAIIAADLTGQVILFNQGACRLYGYEPGEVVQSRRVEELYPDGGAAAVMRDLRASPNGRLEPSRRDIVTKDGETVPVSLSAAIVYADGKEIATVGILTDLRDRLRMEQRLAQAQEKLDISERQAAIAELAGTTAHELNQPLTSIMGYAELLLRKVAEDDPHHRGLATIYQEAERMAEIVRKIGRITHYETKSYVGSTKILDLDRSSEVGNK